VPAAAMEAARIKTSEAIAQWQAESEAIRKAPKTAMKGPLWENLDPWQEQAFSALEQGQSVIVDAPTTAGKTRVIEAFFARNIHHPDFRAAYTTPVKSLSNDKLREFRQMFGSENVGIATGDIKENLDAPIVVATLESYRNSLLGVEPDLGRRIVVFDEYHFLQDSSRGSAWEEAIILTPPRCQILMLSASVANGQQFAEWLGTLQGRKAVLVEAKKRPVPLVDLVWTHQQWLLREALPPELLDKNRINPRHLEFPPRAEDLVERLPPLTGLGLTPCLVYAGRRMSCENLAHGIMRAMDPLAPDHAQKIAAVLQECHTEMRSLSFMPPDLRRMIQVTGVAWHHSGLAAPARMAVERLVKMGLLRFCVATMGLSIGINFAVRSALIADYTRPGESGFTVYGPSEVLQMLGRAGRRGSDSVGFSLWHSPAAWVRLGGATREPCQSRLRNDPTTFLGLVGRGYSLGAIESFYAKSFRRFRDPKADFSLISRKEVASRFGDVPCSSPPAEVALHWINESRAETSEVSLCSSCKHQKVCHKHVEKRLQGSFAHLHLHLHAIGALARDESLTGFGSLARYFPQTGGLLVARMIDQKEITPEQLLKATQLFAALSLARFKEPGTKSSWRFPWPVAPTIQALTDLYPIELFEEVYDQSGRPGRRTDRFDRRRQDDDEGPLWRDFNPAAGFVVSEWLQGCTWQELQQACATEFFGTGDLMALLWRVATWLQSLSQASSGPMRDAAVALRGQLLREPLSLTIGV
jgi:hypothetical protein